MFLKLAVAEAAPTAFTRVIHLSQSFTVRFGPYIRPAVEETPMRLTKEDFLTRYSNVYTKVSAVHNDDKYRCSHNSREETRISELQAPLISRGAVRCRAVRCI